MAIRPRPATVRFLERYSDRTIRELDDQLALNHLLYEEGITDCISQSDSRKFCACGISWVCPGKALVSRDLHSGAIVRHFQQRGESIEELRRALGI